MTNWIVVVCFDVDYGSRKLQLKSVNILIILYLNLQEIRSIAIGIQKLLIENHFLSS